MYLRPERRRTWVSINRTNYLDFVVAVQATSYTHACRMAARDYFDFVELDQVLLQVSLCVAVSDTAPERRPSEHYLLSTLPNIVPRTKGEVKGVVLVAQSWRSVLSSTRLQNTSDIDISQAFSFTYRLAYRV